MHTIQQQPRRAMRLSQLNKANRRARKRYRSEFISMAIIADEAEQRRKREAEILRQAKLIDRQRAAAA